MSGVMTSVHSGVVLKKTLVAVPLEEVAVHGRKRN